MTRDIGILLLFVIFGIFCTLLWAGWFIEYVIARNHFSWWHPATLISVGVAIFGAFFLAGLHYGIDRNLR